MVIDDVTKEPVVIENGEEGYDQPGSALWKVLSIIIEQPESEDESASRSRSRSRSRTFSLGLKKTAEKVKEYFAEVEEEKIPEKVDDIEFSPDYKEEEVQYPEDSVFG